MTILDLLSKAAGLPAEVIRKLLAAVIEKAPDLAPEAEKLLAKLDESLGAAKLVELAGVLVGEIGDIAKGDIKPADHSSDAA